MRHAYLHKPLTTAGAGEYEITSGSEYQLLMMINIADCCYICLHTPLNKALTSQNQEIGFKDHVQHSSETLY